MSDPEILLTDVVLGESPRWHDDRLWFSDWGAQEIVAVDLDGKREVITRVPTFPFCFDWLPDGRLLILGGDGRIRDADGKVRDGYADLTDLASTPWNEIVVDGRGNAYVNNIGFDFPAGPVGPGIVALVTPDGNARQVAGDVAFPNGMLITPGDGTPEGGTLIVAESYASRLTAFDIEPDGSLSNRRVWADLGEGAAPDGIAVDDDGAVWYADVPNRCCVRVCEGGEVLRRVQLDRGCFACAIGGPDRRTLFMVAAEYAGGAGMMSGPKTGQVLLCKL